MNSSYTTVEQSPNRKATTTVSKYEYSKTNVGNEPIYQNDVKTSVNQLKGFINEFEKERQNSYGKYTNGYSNYESSSQQVNQLISNLERNLANPDEALKWKADTVKPISMTEYYEESEKSKNLGTATRSNIDRNLRTSERVRSISPATRADKQRGSSPEATLTTTTYETTTKTKYKEHAGSGADSLRAAQSYQKSAQQTSAGSQQLQSTGNYQKSSTTTSTNNYQQSTGNYQQSAVTSGSQNLSQNLSQSYKQQSSSQQQQSYNQQQQQQQQHHTSRQQQTSSSRQQSRASNATHELDDLMATLDDFKVSDATRHVKTTAQFTNTDRKISSYPEYASIIKSGKPAVYNPRPAGSSGKKEIVSQSTTTTTSKEIKNIDNLENIIGSIEIEMNKQGLETLAKGSCFGCRKPIIGQVITALGRQYHPEHFVCAHCRQELGERTFFERDGQCYCEQDYHNLFAPKCSYCTEPITGRQKCVSALNQTFHEEHFFCRECQVQFTEDKGYHEHNDSAYCADCYLNIFAPKCADCSKPITAAFISALNGQWHTQCFVCTDCRCEFAAGAFFEYEGKPYCETHFHAKKGTLCAGCHKPITGRCVTAMFRKFHPEHFVCCYCLKQLNKGTFKEQNDKPYCHSCFERVFS